MNKEKYKLKCLRCHLEKNMDEMAIIRPISPDTIEQCHPFMSMEVICFECVKPKELEL